MDLLYQGNCVDVRRKLNFAPAQDRRHPLLTHQEVTVQQRPFNSLTYTLPLLLLIGAAYAFEAIASEDMIKYRQAVMKSQGGHMSAAAQIIKGKVNFGSDLHYHAAALAASSMGLQKLFPEGSDFGETRAKPEIWTKGGEFEKAAKDGEKAAIAFLAAVKSNDTAAIAKTFGDLSEACKGCHKKFREKKE